MAAYEAEIHRALFSDPAGANEVGQTRGGSPSEKFSARSNRKTPAPRTQTFRLCYLHDLSPPQRAALPSVSVHPVETYIRQKLNSLRLSGRNMPSIPFYSIFFPLR